MYQTKLTDLLDSKKFNNFELERKYFVDVKQNMGNFDTPDFDKFFVTGKIVYARFKLHKISFRQG